jgi:hypothetical protein
MATCISLYELNGIYILVFPPFGSYWIVCGLKWTCSLESQCPSFTHLHRHSPFDGMFALLALMGVPYVPGHPQCRSAPPKLISSTLAWMEEYQREELRLLSSLLKDSPETFSEGTQDKILELSKLIPLYVCSILSKTVPIRCADPFSR